MKKKKPTKTLGILVVIYAKSGAQMKFLKS